MIDTGILMSRIDKILESVKELAQYSNSLPVDHKTTFLDALQGVSKDLEEVRPDAEELERLASFPELNPQPVMQADLRTGQVEYLNPAGELMFPDLRAAGVAHAWLAGLDQAADVLLRADARFFSRELKLGDRWFEQNVIAARDGSGLRVYGRDVTARKRAEQELAASRAEALNEKNRLEAVMEALPVGMAIVDAQGGLVRANRAYDEIWGTPRPEARTVADYSAYKAWWAESGEPVKPEDWASARAIREGEAVVGQTMRIETFGGASAHVLNSAAPIFDAGRRIVGSAVAIQDISARVRAEESLKKARVELEVRVKERTEELKRTLDALEAEHQRFNDVLDMLPAYVALLTPDYHVPFVNRFFKERFGDSGGRRCYEFLFDRTEACPACESYKVLKTLAPHRWEWTGPDGRDYDISDFPFTDRDGSRLILEMGIDVTDRKRAEEERLRLATAVEQIADGVAILDPEGRILSANPAFGVHLGRQPGELIGRDLREVLEIAAEDGETGEKLQGSLDSGRSWNGRLKRNMRNGRVREFDLTVSPIRDGSGRFVNAIAVERDVTQEVLLEEQVRQWQKMEALGTLAGGIAHDFNNILLPILINTELMLAGENAESPAARRLSQVLEAARRGRDMVKQIIAFSRQKEQERKPVEVPPIIRESVKFLRVSIPKSVEIVEKIDSSSAVAVADPTQLQQVLMNLGSNAAHAMREKGGVLEVGLSDAYLDEEAAARFIDLKPGPYLRLTVRDTGHGMPPDVQARVFEPFFTTKKPGEGTGMGLAVVHGIVKSHGGAISVVSEPGRGTTFTIHLPKITGVPPAEEQRTETFPGGTERVLFVDDEDIQVRAMNKLLEHLGYRVIGISDPWTALDVFRREPGAFDLVITDQTMPHMSGGELAREMLRIRPGLPVILCTGYSENIDEDEALAMGIKAFVLKPFSVKEIAETIRRVLPRES